MQPTTARLWLSPILGLLSILFTACNTPTTPTNSTAGMKGRTGLFARDTLLRAENVPERSVVEMRTWLYNPLSQGVNFTVDAPGCPCLSVSPTEGEIAPGDSLCLRVKYNSTGQLGYSIQQLTVREMGSSQTVDIMVETSVKSHLILTPVSTQE